MPTQQLTLPARLKTLYDQFPHAPAATTAQQSFLPTPTVCDGAGQWLTLSPEHTDHVINHLNSVLASSNALIPPHYSRPFSNPLLTPQ